MKKPQMFWAGLVFVTGLIFILHAQDATLDTALPVQAAALQVEPLPLTAKDIRILPLLSDKDLATFIEAMVLTPTIEPEDLPPFAPGFWSLQNPNWPPLPGNIKSVPAWQLNDGSFLLSDLDTDYSGRKKKTGGGMQRMSMDPSDPGDGGGTYTPSFASYAPIDFSTNLWLAITNVANNIADLLISNTVADVLYEIQGKPDLLATQWVSEGFVLGSELTNWTPTSITATDYPTLFLRVKSWGDSDGSGMPDWWQLQNFGTTGVDPYGDADGDGWNNLQEYQNGTNPNSFNTPPTPQGLNAIYNVSTAKAAVSWQPSPSPVTGYTVERSDDSGVTDFTFSASTNDFLDDISSDLPDPSYGGDLLVFYRAKAHYASGDSAWTDWVGVGQNGLTASIIAGPQGTAYLAVSTVPPNTSAIRLTEVDHLQLPNVIITNYDVSMSNFTNGLYLLPNQLVPGSPYTNHDYNWYGQAVGTNGKGLTATTFLSEDYTSQQGAYENSWLVPPYFDGRAQLKQNLIFQLRAALADRPFQFTGSYTLNGHTRSFFSSPTNYAYAGFYSLYDNGGGYFVSDFDVFLPFEENYMDRNFVLNTSDLDSNGRTATGVGGLYGALTLTVPPLYQFSAPTTNGATIASVLATNATRWLATYPLDSSYSYLKLIGITNTASYPSSVFVMYSNVKNWFGLTNLSAEIGSSGPATITLNAGGTSTQDGYFYPETAQPQFQLVGYDNWKSPVSFYDLLASGSDFPGLAGLPTLHTNPVLIAAVGDPYFQIACYAKLAVTNSAYTGVYGFLGQYFDKAYKVDSSGVVTTNTTGVLSSYGNFFATEPGPVALVTMPDIDTGARGTNIVYAINLQLDANHDGVMDLSFNGADNTSPSQPFVFWLNNNYDRLILDSDDATNYQDDLGPIDIAKLSADAKTPDCHYGEYYGTRFIPTTRDLEDFARLWICGVTSNLLAALPTNSTVTLSWGDVGSPNTNNPTIDLFVAADSDGGIGYLTNSSVGSNQINGAFYPFIQRLAPGGSIQLNANFFGNTWRGDHFIWCGVTSGSGQLNLIVADGHSNVLAQSSQWIQIKDIKQMYERWTVGEQPKLAPTNMACLAVEGLPVGASAFKYMPPQDTNTPYILFVHGWNMETWEKDRFAETAFKRLYWQGYQGRFGSFRWPTDYGFGTYNSKNPITDPRNFDNSEFNAWRSGVGLLYLLTDLYNEYRNHVFVLAHSMGNVVAGEALRYAGTNQIVNTYIASQGAIAAHAYDDSLSDSLFASSSPKTPNIYIGGQ
jgi:hypothetical protein